MMETQEKNLEIRYKDIISVGAYGTVYRGSYFQQEVAVKILRATEPEQKLYVCRELETIKNARHPNIIQFFYDEVRAEEVVIVTEYAERGNLESLLFEPRLKLNEKRKLLILKDVASAMHYLHSQRYMHRDLKAENVVVTKNWTAKVCDFGLARPLPQNGDQGTHDVGTGRWKAPEVLLGQTHTCASDVFSFGLLIFEMIFECSPPKRKVIEGFKLQLDNIDIPEGNLRELFILCCSENPKDRPAFKEIVPTLEERCKEVEEEPKTFTIPMDIKMSEEIKALRKKGILRSSHTGGEFEKTKEKEEEEEDSLSLIPGSINPPQPTQAAVDVSEPVRKAVEEGMRAPVQKLQEEISLLKNLVTDRILPALHQKTLEQGRTMEQQDAPPKDLEWIGMLTDDVDIKGVKLSTKVQRDKDRLVAYLRDMFPYSKDCVPYAIKVHATQVEIPLCSTYDFIAALLSEEKIGGKANGIHTVIYKDKRDFLTACRFGCTKTLRGMWNSFMQDEEDVKQALLEVKRLKKERSQEQNLKED